MSKEIQKYQSMVRSALRAAGLYNKSLEIQVHTLAVALMSFSKASEEVSKLDGVTIIVKFDNGSERPVTHPAYGVLKDMMASITKQMKALGLSAATLSPDGGDPMVELTEKVLAEQSKHQVVKPKEESHD